MVHAAPTTTALVALLLAAPLAAAQDGPRSLTPEQLQEDLFGLMDNFESLSAHALAENAAPLLENIRPWSARSLVDLGRQFRARKQAGKVRECHGDLHGLSVESFGLFTRVSPSSGVPKKPPLGLANRSSSETSHIALSYHPTSPVAANRVKRATAIDA